MRLEQVLNIIIEDNMARLSRPHHVNKELATTALRLERDRQTYDRSNFNLTTEIDMEAARL